jgi:hypothetical protein
MADHYHRDGADHFTDDRWQREFVMGDSGENYTERLIQDIHLSNVSAAPGGLILTCNAIAE